MTTDTRTTRRGRPRQMLLLLALLAWLVPQGAQATHVDDTWKYQVALNGANTVRIQVPVYDQEGADCWVSDGNSRSKEKVSGLSDVEVTMPDAPEVIHPQVTMASMSYSVAGKMELPWFIASKTITALRYEYIDAYGITVRHDLPTNENNGTIYLDATVPHDKFCVVASYKDSNEDDINNVSSTIQNLTMIHAPVGLTATQIDHARRGGCRVVHNMV